MIEKQTSNSTLSQWLKYKISRLIFVRAELLTSLLLQSNEYVTTVRIDAEVDLISYLMYSQFLSVCSVTLCNTINRLSCSTGHTKKTTLTPSINLFPSNNVKMIMGASSASVLFAFFSFFSSLSRIHSDLFVILFQCG